jgi:adenylate cyclase
MAVLDQPASTRKLAAILSADIAGYSALMSADEEGTVRKLREVREAVLPIIARFGGRVIDLAGDGILAEFPSAVRAVESATAVQSRMAELNAECDPQMLFRIGVNVGDVIHEGDRLYGDGINVAARLQAIADPGGICISNKVHEEVRDRVPLAFKDMGDQELKNIARPVRAFSAAPTGAAGATGLGAKKYFKKRVSHRLKLVGGVVISIASAGAVLGGLTGYWNAWKTVKAELSRPDATPIAQQSTGFVRPTPQQSSNMGSVTSGHPIVAIVPVANETGDAANDAFSRDLTRALTAALSRFTQFRVEGPKATAHGATETSKTVATYIVQGEARQSGQSLSATVRLVDGQSGRQFWTKSFRTGDGRSLDADVVADRASAIVGSYWSGVAAAEFPRIQAKPVGDLTPYECVVQGVLATSLTYSAEAYSRGLTCLQALVSSEPTNGQAWAALAVIYFHQRLYGIGLPADLATDINKRSYFGQRSLESALKAVDLLPNDGFARKTLANAYYVTCQRDRIRIESQRAVDLSPNDPSVLGPLGTFLAFSGDWDAGAALVERAIDLIAPANPRWWWRSLGDREWLRGEYQQAYNLFQRSYVEQNWVSHMELAKTLPFLGRMDEARAEIVTIRRMKPDFSIRDVRDYLHSWCFADDYINRVEAILHDVGLTE